MIEIERRSEDQGMIFPQEKLYVSDEIIELNCLVEKFCLSEIYQKFGGGELKFRLFVVTPSAVKRIKW